MAHVRQVRDGQSTSDLPSRTFKHGCTEGCFCNRDLLHDFWGYIRDDMFRQFRGTGCAGSCPIHGVPVPRKWDSRFFRSSSTRRLCLENLARNAWVEFDTISRPEVEVVRGLHRDLSEQVDRQRTTSLNRRVVPSIARGHKAPIGALCQQIEQGVVDDALRVGAVDGVGSDVAKAGQEPDDDG